MYIEKFEYTFGIYEIRSSVQDGIGNLEFVSFNTGRMEYRQVDWKGHNFNIILEESRNEWEHYEEYIRGKTETFNRKLREVSSQ